MKRSATTSGQDLRAIKQIEEEVNDRIDEW
jgi:hypothetical protein